MRLGFRLFEITPRVHNNSYSENETILFSILQGSILVMLCLFFYLNALPNSSRLNYDSLFADDNIFYRYLTLVVNEKFNFETNIGKFLEKAADVASLHDESTQIVF